MVEIVVPAKRQITGFRRRLSIIIGKTKPRAALGTKKKNKIKKI